jgi:hypothetical protein
MSYYAQDPKNPRPLPGQIACTYCRWPCWPEDLTAGRCEACHLAFLLERGDTEPEEDEGDE